MTTYTVKGGDTLSLIAERMLGDMSRWPEIATLNKISTPNLILPGQVLQLPDPPSSLTVDHSSSEAGQGQPAAPAAAKSKGMVVVVLLVIAAIAAGYFLYRYSKG